MKHPNILVVLASLAWLAGSCSLLIKGSTLLVGAEEIVPGTVWPWFSAGLGFLVGVGKGWFIVTAGYEKNAARIRALLEPRWWNFFSGRFFMSLLAMIVVGVSMSRIADGQFEWMCVVGGIDLSVGLALAVSCVRGGLRVSRSQIKVTPS